MADNAFRLVTAATAAILAAACGARASLRVDPPVGEGGSGGATSTLTTTAGTGGDFPDAGGPPPCVTWKIATPTPIALTDPVGDSLLSGVAVEPSRIFIGSLNNNDPSPDPTWRVRVVSPDLGSIGPSQIVMKHATSISLSGMGIASGSGHRGGVAWDEINGCRFVALADDGSAAAPPLKIADTWCYWPYATPGGFTTFVSPTFLFAPLTMLTLDPGGKVLAQKPDVVPASPGSPATSPAYRARFDDGSLALAWSEGASGSGAIRLRHFTASGDAVGPIANLLPLTDDTQLAFASRGASLLFAWSSNGDGEIRAQPIDPDGNLLGADSQLAPADGLRVGDLAAAMVPGGALVAWSKGDAGAYKTLTVQPVTTDGAPMGPPFDVPTPPFLGKIVLLPTVSGVVIAFDALEPGKLTQVFVTRLACGD